MNRVPAPSASRRADLLIILAFSLVTLGLLLFASAKELKWTVFTLASLVCLAAALIIPNRQKFFLFLFIFFLPVRVDFYPIYIETTFFRPINGLGINAYDIPFFFLMLSWGMKIILEPDQRFELKPLISIPFLLIVLWTLVGLWNAETPAPIKVSVLWLELECWLVFLYMMNNLKDRETIERVIFALLITVFIQAGIGFAQRLVGGRLGLGMFGEAERSVFEALAGSGTISRVGGTLGHPNKLAAYINMILPVGFALLFTPLPRKAKTTFLLPLLGAGLLLELLTFSRGGWVGLALGGTITFTWCVARVTRRQLIVFFLLIVMTVLTAGSSVLFITTFRKRLLEDDYGSARLRVPMAIVAANIISQNPWFGVGLTNYTSVANRYDPTREAVSYDFPMPVHNEFLLIAAEIGIPALVFTTFIFLTVMIQLIRLGRSRADPFRPFLAMGFLGGIVAWVVHMNFEFNHVVMLVSLWGYFGLIQAVIAFRPQPEPLDAPGGAKPDAPPASTDVPKPDPAVRTAPRARAAASPGT